MWILDGTTTNVVVSDPSPLTALWHMLQVAIAVTIGNWLHSLLGGNQNK